jgi:hypothetical protein
MDRKPIFDAVRKMLERGFSQAEVEALDLAINQAGGALLPPIEAERVRTLKDLAAFYVAVRKVTGPLDQMQVDIIERLLKEAGGWGIGWLAYGLATAWHEARLNRSRNGARAMITARSTAPARLRTAAAWCN